MNRTNQPPELHFRHYELNAFKCKFFAAFIIQQKKYSGEHLDDEEKQRNTAEIVPYSMTMNGNIFFPHKMNNVFKVNALIYPRVYFFQKCFHTFFETKISSFLMTTRYSSNGLGGGPEIFLPFKSYFPLWHAHQITPNSFLYCTVQSRCVHVALNA